MSVLATGVHTGNYVLTPCDTPRAVELILASLNPGIRRTVRWLNENGFKTVDSGDGRTHEFKCDRETAYVVIAIPPEQLVTETLRLCRLLEEKGIGLLPISEDNSGIHIQATFDPSDGTSFIDLVNVDDTTLFGERT